MVENVTNEEFYQMWLKTYLKKFGGEEPVFGRGLLNERTRELIDAVRTNTPIDSLDAPDLDL